MMKAECRVASIPGFGNEYFVTDSGDVISAKSGRKLKPSALPSGYLRVKLYKNSVPKMFMVHRLVAEAFKVKGPDKTQVNHIDGNKANNNYTNLEWVTQSENQIHAFINGLNSTEKAVNANKKKVVQLSEDGTLINKWGSMADASRATGAQVSNISRCCNGTLKRAGGYVWRYLEQ